MPQGRILLGAPHGVGARGFEPPTSCAQGRRATRLRYAPREATAGGNSIFPRRASGSALAASESLERWPQALQCAAAVAQAVLLQRCQLRQRPARRLVGQEE